METLTDTQNIPEIVKEIRARNGWTQEKLAAVLGKNQTVISRYESGQRIPPGDVLLKILSLKSISEKQQ